jgi:hypothetical protein
MKLFIVVMHPRESVIDALCEHICEFAHEVGHVASAHLQSRSVTSEGTVVSVQRWRARAAVPELLRHHLEDGLLEWTLSIERPVGGHECHWRAESTAVQVPGRCHGTMVFLPAAGGRGTCIEVHYDFAAANEGLRTIFGTLVAKHWRSLAEAGARWIAVSSPRG